MFTAGLSAFLGQVIVHIDLSCAAGGGWFFRFIGRWLWWVYEQGMLATCGIVKIVTRLNRHPAKSSHCGKGGWTRLFAFAYTPMLVRWCAECLLTGQVKPHGCRVVEMAADKIFLLWGLLWIWSH